MTATKTSQINTDDLVQPDTPVDSAPTDAKVTPESDAHTTITLSPRQQAFALS